MEKCSMGDCGELVVDFRTGSVGGSVEKPLVEVKADFVGRTLWISLRVKRKID